MPSGHTMLLLLLAFTEIAAAVKALLVLSREVATPDERTSTALRPCAFTKRRNTNEVKVRHGFGEDS